MKRATPGNHPHKPLPEQRAQLKFSRSLTDEEYRALIHGVIPRSADDKWFAFEVDDWFSLCRASTGHCIFRLRLEETGNSWRVAEAWVNRDPDQYASDNDEADAQMLGRLLDAIIEQNTA